MKTTKPILLALFAFIAFSAMAQAPSAVRYNPTVGTAGVRNEIYIPKVMGYNVYKADLHTHTIYSDGEMTPSLRVREAWLDGLDIIAITDHMEYRRTERELVQYMKGYIDKTVSNGGKAMYTNVLKVDKQLTQQDFLVDFNVAHKSASKEGKKLDIMVIKGVEITRGKLGDYNALFTTDNNIIYDANLEQTIRNARKQGAFIFHNHPQYSSKTTTTMPPHCEDFHAKGLIDGIEIANGFKTYDRLFDYCLNGNYAPFATSDAHGLISARFPGAGKEYYRNMTLILAKERTEKSIKEALKAKRTIAYTANMLIGKESLLSELFKACVEVKVLGTDKKGTNVLLTNKSSLPFALMQNGKAEQVLLANSTAIMKVHKKSKSIKFAVTNMLYGADKKLTVSYPLK